MDGLIKLFIGRLPRHYGEGEIQNLVMPFGTCREVIVIRNHATGESKGCCFVKFSTHKEAQACISNLDGSLVDGQCLGCSLATDRRSNQKAVESKPFRNIPTPHLQLQPVQLQKTMMRQVIVPQQQVLRSAAYGDSEGNFFVGGVTRENDMKNMWHDRDVFVPLECSMVVRHTEPKNHTSSLQYGDPIFADPVSGMVGNDANTEGYQPECKGTDDSSGQVPRQMGDWFEYVDMDGSLYYHNVLTNQTQWDVPPEFQHIIPPSSVVCDSPQWTSQVQQPILAANNAPTLKTPQQFCKVPHFRQPFVQLQNNYVPVVNPSSTAQRYAPF